VPLPLTPPEYVKAVSVAFKSLAPAVLKEYPLSDYPSPFYAFATQEFPQMSADGRKQFAKTWNTPQACGRQR
jgi:hypothetical protein